jgi:hypothetical protein
VRISATMVSDPSQRAVELVNPRVSDGYGELLWATGELEGGWAPAEGSEPAVHAVFEIAWTNARVAPTAAQAATSNSTDVKRDRKRATESEYRVWRTFAVTDSTQIGADRPAARVRQTEAASLSSFSVFVASRYS